MENTNEIINDIVGALHGLTQEVMRLKTRVDALYNNNSVRVGWCGEINKAKIDYMLEVERIYGVTMQKREQEIIVSLTSYPERMYDVKYTLYSLLHQTLKPDRIILWLAREQFPNLEEDIAPCILKMKEWGLTIRWCEDIRSYKKLVPALREFPDDLIVTADDDLYYPENWLELLYNSYVLEPEMIHSHRAHEVLVQDNVIRSYREWKKEIEARNPSYYCFATSGAGTIYPPNSLHKDVCNVDKFMKLSPNADDVWFWAMGILNETKVKVINGGVKKVKWVNPLRELGGYNETTLSMTNTGANRMNDVYLTNVLREYPEVLERLVSEKERF